MSTAMAFPGTSAPPAPSVRRSAWLEVLSHIDPKYGGLSSAVPPLGAALVQAGVSVCVAAFVNAGERYRPADLEADQLSYWPSSRSAWIKPAQREAFRAVVRRSSGVHVHGLWEQSTALAAGEARAARLPYVLSAHGMLEPWALRQRRWKKALYAALVERRNVAGASCLHALTEAEARQYAAFGARGPIAIIPNAITVPQFLRRDLFRRRFPHANGRRVVLFLGRLHVKKGLDLLIDAWAAIARSFPDALLVIAGPDADGSEARLTAAVEAKQLAHSVIFTGMLEGEMKWSALAAAEGFVLPSFSEGLSVGTLEALGVGKPVIITEGCNMPEVRARGAGWVIEAEVAPLTAALSELMRNSQRTNEEIGIRGAELIRTHYSWPVVGGQMADLYAWLEGGPKPESVRFFRRESYGA